MSEAICPTCKRPDDTPLAPSASERCGIVHASDGCGQAHSACMNCNGKRLRVAQSGEVARRQPSGAVPADSCPECKHPLSAHSYYGKCLIKKRPDQKYVVQALADLPSGWKACQCPGAPERVKVIERAAQPDGSGDGGAVQAEEEDETDGLLDELMGDDDDNEGGAIH